MEAVSGDKKLVLVTDKGFYSGKNVKMLLEKYNESEFLMAVPFTNNWAKEIVRELKDTIDRADNLIKTSGQSCRGTSRRIALFDRHLTAHVLYNPERALTERNELYNQVVWLKEMIEAGIKIHGFENEIEKYLIIKNGKAIKIQINQQAIELELETSGWLVILGNGKISVQKAHDIYRKKDVVEKAFMKYKNTLGLYRLRVHGDERMRNKLFVAFMALALVSHIHKIMKEKDLYKKMTMEKMFLTLSKLKKIAINGQNILRPLTKEQHEIFSAFSISRPFVG